MEWWRVVWIVCLYLCVCVCVHTNREGNGNVNCWRVHWKALAARVAAASLHKPAERPNQMNWNFKELFLPLLLLFYKMCMCVYLLDKQGRPRKGDVSRILKLRPHIKLRPKEIAPIRWAGVSIGAMAGGLFRLGSDGCCLCGPRV